MFVRPKPRKRIRMLLEAGHDINCHVLLAGEKPVKNQSPSLPLAYL